MQKALNLEENMADHKTLTFIEASCVVAGFSIGGAVMAVPYLATLSNPLSFVAILAAAFVVSVTFHLMIAEMIIRDSSSHQLVELFAKYCFRGKFSKLIWVLFLLIYVGCMTNLTAYISGGSEILEELIGTPKWGGYIIVYLVAASVVLFELKAIAISEKYAMLIIAVILGILAVSSINSPVQANWKNSGGHAEALALFSMLMFCFTAPFSVQQVASGLHWNKKLIPKAIVTGFVFNLVLVTVITFCAVSVSHEVTAVAITGWGKALSPWALIIGSVLILLAMLTTYWALSFALVVIIQERIGASNRIAWLAATLPSFLAAITGVTDFIGFLRLTTAASGFLVAMSIVPALRGVIKHGDVEKPAFTFSLFSNIFFQIGIIMILILMSIGALVPIR